MWRLVASLISLWVNLNIARLIMKVELSQSTDLLLNGSSSTPIVTHLRLTWCHQVFMSKVCDVVKLGLVIKIIFCMS